MSGRSVEFEIGDFTLDNHLCEIVFKHALDDSCDFADREHSRLSGGLVLLGVGASHRAYDTTVESRRQLFAEAVEEFMILRIVGEPNRYRILQYLRGKPRNVSEIVRSLGPGQSLVSHHLKTLKECGLLEAIREGPFVRYSVSSKEVKNIFLLATEIVRKNTLNNRGRQ